MCGILAIFCNTTPLQLKEIIESSEYLKKRGPDSCVHISNESGIFIFHRLSINDTSSLGDQPMISGDKLLMCNGEIYNHKELEREYNLVCKSKSDCEVILRLYEKLLETKTPEDAFVTTYSKLDGYFAIVLVDGNKTFLARDRIGIRPLFLGTTQEGFVSVASVPNALEFCKDIKPFPPGECVIVENSRFYNSTIITSLYKDSVKLLDILESNKPEKSFKFYQDHLKFLLIEAVRKRLMSDRPIACLLSGGLDSSIITAILARLNLNQKLHTYSIGMEGSTDLYYARKVADYLNAVNHQSELNHKIEHHEVIFTPDEGFAAIPEIIRCLATYDITTIRASVGMYLIAKYISENTKDKVIFSGEGSDEILCGYLYFHNAPTAKDAEKESHRLVEELHLYDVLRADRTISSNGLELRVPFLDKDVVDHVFSMPAEYKIPIRKHEKDFRGFEKYILRKAFEDYLPDEIVWRRKEGFSDGVSSIKKAWYVHIQERVEKIIPDYLFSKNFPSKEAMYYKLIFDHYFPNYKLEIPYWMPKWSDAKDPSGRMISAYDEKQE